MRSPVAEVLGSLAAAFGRIGARWYLFGAQAAIVHGSSRLTTDVDVTISLGLASTRELVEALAEEGLSLRVSDSDAFVARTRVLPVLHLATGVDVDVVLAGPGLEDGFLERAVAVDIEGVQVPVARAEDMLAMKILAGRPKDLEDSEAILRAKRDSLDLGLVRATLHALEVALDRADLVPELQRLEARVRQGRN